MKPGHKNLLFNLNKLTTYKLIDAIQLKTLETNMKYIQIILLSFIVGITLIHFNNLTPAEKEHCLITSSDKTICK